MKKQLYLYQIERFETDRFLRRVIKNLFGKKTDLDYEIKWDLKSKFIFYYSIAIFIIISAVLIILTPYYIFIPGIVLVWFLRFLIIIFSEKMFSLYEKRADRKKIESAQQKINAFNEINFVGIAGSSGKTSFKKILAELLGNKTEMSEDKTQTIVELAETINKKLTIGIDNFLFEMNAEKQGKIKNMCQLIQPNIGVLLNINEQHLDRYKKIENTIRAKFEILNNLDNESFGLVNLDDALVRENLKQAKALRLIGYSLEGRTSDFCEKVISAKNFEIQKFGSWFSIEFEETEYVFETILIGKNQLSNILGAVACAIELGLKPDMLVEKVKNLEQISHKMELKTRDGIYILDNSGGSNVNGFKNSLDVISMFDRKKVVVSPGVYEVGEKSNEVHKMLGFMISKVADLIILLGESDRTDNIRTGALDNDFDKNKIVRVKDLDEVYKFIDKSLGEHDVVLLENDLDVRFL